MTKSAMISSVGLLCFAVACSSDDDADASDPSHDDDHDHGDDDHDHGDDDHDHDDDDHDHDHDHDAPHGSLGAPRLVIADGASPQIAFVDPHDGDIVKYFDLEGTARVYSDPSYTYAFAIQRDQDRVDIFSSGLDLEDHGDHFDPIRNEPTHLALNLSGGQPTHFTAHGQLVAVFMDGRAEATDDFAASGSEVHVLDLTEIEGSGDLLNLGAGGAHHGVAVPWSPTQIILTESNTPSPLPDLVRYVNENGEEEDSWECPGLHGEAASDTAMAFGCSDGVLYLEAQGEGFEATKIAHPEDAPEDTRVGTLSYAGGTWVGNFGSTGLVVLNPEDATMTSVALDEEYYSFRVTEDGEAITLLSKDGALRWIDTEGEVQGEVADVTSEPDPDAPPHSPTGSMAVYEGEVFVTNPETGAVTVVSAETHEIENTVDTEMSPTTLAVLAFPE